VFIAVEGEGMSDRNAHHSWNSALVHSNLWSGCLKRLEFWNRTLKSALGVVMTTTRGRRKPNMAGEVASRTGGFKCSILRGRKRRRRRKKDIMEVLGMSIEQQLF